jgi:RND family efflux transporter MFP subunit
VTRFQLILGLALVGGLSLVAYGFLSKPDPKIVQRPLTKVVAKAPFEHVIVEQGEVESSSNVEIRCEVKARGTSGITIIDVVPEGTVVEKGDLLVKLDSTALDQEYISQQIACNTAEATAIQSKNTFEAAQIAKTEYLEATFKQEEQLVLSEVFVAEQNLRTAELAFASTERLALRGQVNPLQLEGEQFAVDKARKDLEAAKTKLDGLRKYTKEKMLKQLDSDITSAEAKWKADQKSLELEMSKLKDIEDQIAKCTIRAPRAGQVVYANKYSQGRTANAEFVVEPGAVVREQQPIVRLPDANLMQIKATINESRINAVRPGMPVAIRVEALRDEILQGEVTKVNQYAEPGGWGSTVKKYATFVRIISPPAELRAGMNAEVRIFVERQPEAIQIPVQAIAEHKEHFFCLVEQPDGALETKEIERGPSNDKFMVVLGGVKEGDRVVLDPRSRNELELPQLPDPAPVASTIKPPGSTPVVMQTGSARPDGPAPEAGKGPPRGPGGDKRGGPPTPAQMVARTLEEYDTNKDGTLQASELAAMPEDRRGRMGEADTNKDGNIDRAELTTAMARVAQMIRERMQGGQ